MMTACFKVEDDASGLESQKAKAHRLSIGHLGRALHPSRSKLKLMLGLTAYFDESGHADDPRCRFVGIGGLCAPLAAWEEFDEKWQGILDDQCGGQPFHMKEFSFGEGQFKEWSKPEREKLLGALVKTIKESKARPFGAVVSLDAWDFVCKSIPGIDKFLGEPYHLVLSRCYSRSHC
jgi:hypothetical protein